MSVDAFRVSRFGSGQLRLVDVFQWNVCPPPHLHIINFSATAKWIYKGNLYYSCFFCQSIKKKKMFIRTKRNFLFELKFTFQHRIINTTVLLFFAPLTSVPSVLLLLSPFKPYMTHIVLLTLCSCLALSAQVNLNIAKVWNCPNFWLCFDNYFLSLLWGKWVRRKLLQL